MRTHNDKRADPWFAVYVRPHHEKAVGRALEGRQHEQFTPMYVNRHRARTVEAPLFPGYVFSRINPDDRLPVLAIPGVLFIVRAGAKLAEIDECEITALRAASAARCAIEPCQYLRLGQKFQLVSGPLRGLDAIFQGADGSHAVISITLLQRSVSVRIDPAWLDAFPPPLSPNSPHERLNR